MEALAFILLSKTKVLDVESLESQTIAKSIFSPIKARFSSKKDRKTRSIISKALGLSFFKDIKE